MNNIVDNWLVTLYQCLVGASSPGDIDERTASRGRSAKGIAMSAAVWKEAA